MGDHDRRTRGSCSLLSNAGELVFRQVSSGTRFFSSQNVIRYVQLHPMQGLLCAGTTYTVVHLAGCSSRREVHAVL